MRPLSSLKYQQILSVQMRDYRQSGMLKGYMKRTRIKWILLLASVALGILIWVLSSRPPALSQNEQKVSALQLAETSWQRPRFSEFLQERRHMVERQIARHPPAVQSGAVLDAMRQVPRHLFVSSRLQDVAYADRPLPIGHGQTISQPYIVALMTEALKVKPGAKILEIGTGSGYQAAVLSELTPSVYTIEIIHALGEKARKRFKSLVYV